MNADYVSEIDYLLIGHLTADMTPEGRVLGGTSSYAAATARSFGLRVGVVTSALVDDPLIDELRPWANIHLIPSASTTTFENVYTSNGRVQYLRAAASSITLQDVPGQWRSCPLVHIAPMANEVAADIASGFPQAITLLTLQGWLRRWEADQQVRFRRWHDKSVLNAVDFVVFSEEDIREAPDMEVAIAHDANTLVVTLAEKGGNYYQNGVKHHYSTPQVDVVHPTGAGDIFAASLLAAYWKTGKAMDRAIAIAARLAALSVTRSGLSSAPTPDEVQRVLKRP